jgi:sulfinoalanine decarboxylase
MILSCLAVNLLRNIFNVVKCPQGLMHHCNSASASYLFQQDKFYDVSFDTGDKSVQCGRKVDAFKLWLMWKAHGNNGFESLINNAMDASR